MTDIAVIYQSKYGSTETYARWIAEDLGADLLAADKVKTADMQKYDVIVYGGGLYAGGVSGISFLTKNYDAFKDKALYLFTVGAADVNDPENTAAIRSALEKVLPPAMQDILHIFHLRAGMWYSKMSILHRGMMSLMVKAVRKKPESALCAEDKMVLETYGQDVDFTDRHAIAPLIADIKAGAAAAESLS